MNKKIKSCEFNFENIKQREKTIIKNMQNKFNSQIQELINKKGSYNK